MAQTPKRNFQFADQPLEAQHNLKLLGLRCWFFLAPSKSQQISSAKLEQDLAAAIRLQGLLERFLKLVERESPNRCHRRRSRGIGRAPLARNPDDCGAGPEESYFVSPSRDITPLTRFRPSPQLPDEPHCGHKGQTKPLRFLTDDGTRKE